VLFSLLFSNNQFSRQLNTSHAQGVNYDPMNPMGKEESFKADMKATTRVTSLVTK
jgi:hypothetical protein